VDRDPVRERLEPSMRARDEVILQKRKTGRRIAADIERSVEDELATVLKPDDERRGARYVPIPGRSGRVSSIFKRIFTSLSV
jgi:hypothetical protein